MNHCLLEEEVLEAPQVRYTQDNQTPRAEMTVRIDGLRPDDPPGQLKVVGWGNLAQDLQNRVVVGQRLVLEGRLRINTLTRQDGLKEKRAEFTLSRLHPLPSGSGSGFGSVASQGMDGDAFPQASFPPASAAPISDTPPDRGGQSRQTVVRRSAPTAAAPAPAPAAPAPAAPAPAAPVWNTSPLVPEEMDEAEDDIPF